MSLHISLTLNLSFFLQKVHFAGAGGGSWLVVKYLHLEYFVKFEIECRCGGHSITKKFKTILQILLAKPKLWTNLYFYKLYIFNVKINFFLLKSGKMLLAVPKNGKF